MTERGRLRRRTLVLVALVAGAATALLYRLLERANGTTPHASWAVGLVLAIVAAVLVAAGRRVTATRRGTTDRPLPPIGAYRVLLMAQACALTGAVAVGAYLAVALRGLPDLAAASVRADVLSAAATVLGAAALLAAGLYVESACRIDPPGPDAPADPRDDAVA